MVPIVDNVEISQLGRLHLADMWVSLHITWLIMEAFFSPTWRYETNFTKHLLVNLGKTGGTENTVKSAFVLPHIAIEGVLTRQKCAEK